MTEIELSKYCRSHGYYVDDVKVWRQNCIEGNGQKSKYIKKPTTFKATAPNQVWTWDITWLNTYVRGKYYRLYLILDIFRIKFLNNEI